MILVVCSSSCSDVNGPVESREIPLASTNVTEGTIGTVSGNHWALLIYISADMEGTIDPFEYYAAMLHSSDNVDVLVLDDRVGETAKIWYIDANRNAVLLEDLGEINTGTPSTLANYLEYGKTNYPSDRYFVSIYGHGGAWAGTCPDMDPGADMLRMTEINQTLTDFGGVDIIMFTACTMGAVESAYELRDCADVYISNENLAVYFYWNKVFDFICSELECNPSVSNHELGRLIIEWMDKDKKGHAQYGYMEYWSSSAIRTDKLAALAGSIDDLALGYMSDPSHFKALVDAAGENVPYFSNCNSVDMNSLLTCIYDAEDDAEMKMNISNVMDRLSEAVIAESHFSKYRNMKGVSIFLPNEAGAADIEYYAHPIIGLDFVTDTSWDEFLYAIYPGSIAAGSSEWARTFSP